MSVGRRIIKAQRDMVTGDDSAGAELRYRFRRKPSAKQRAEMLERIKVNLSKAILGETK